MPAALQTLNPVSLEEVRHSFVVVLPLLRDWPSFRQSTLALYEIVHQCPLADRSDEIVPNVDNIVATAYNQIRVFAGLLPSVPSRPEPLQRPTLPPLTLFARVRELGWWFGSLFEQRDRVRTLLESLIRTGVSLIRSYDGTFSARYGNRPLPQLRNMLACDPLFLLSYTWLDTIKHAVDVLQFLGLVSPEMNDILSPIGIQIQDCAVVSLESAQSHYSALLQRLNNVPLLWQMVQEEFEIVWQDRCDDQTYEIVPNLDEMVAENARELHYLSAQLTPQWRPSLATITVICRVATRMAVGAAVGASFGLLFKALLSYYRALTPNFLVGFYNFCKKGLDFS